MSQQPDADEIRDELLRAIRADAALASAAATTPAADATAAGAATALDACDARAGRRAEGRRRAGPAPQSRPEPASPRVRRSTTTGSTAGFASRPTSGRRRGCRSSSGSTSIWTTTHKEFTIHDADGKEQTGHRPRVHRAVRKHRDSCARRVPARQQPAVRVPRPAGRRHRSAVGRARQVAVRIARLPGLPLARRVPGHRTRRKAPTCRASPPSSTPSKGQRWLYSWVKAAEPLPRADGDAERVPRSDRGKRRRAATRRAR